MDLLIDVKHKEAETSSGSLTSLCAVGIRFMRYGLCNSTRVEPQPQGRAVCPTCDGTLIAHCGDIITWHWAHESGADCDPWSEGETDWHVAWKLRFPIEYREVVVGHHRADVRAPDGTVVELQHSYISPAEIQERESFYRNMIWIFDASQMEFGLRDRGTHWTFRWFHPRKSLWSCRRRIYFDFGPGKFSGELFHIKKLPHHIPCGGWGEFLDVGEFTHSQLMSTARI